MKPFLEVLQRPQDASWSMLNRRLEDCIPFQWHHHPEFELTLTTNSLGQRFIGDHAGSYEDGDLVLVGPNLPHSWSSRAKLSQADPHVALVLWFHPNWIRQLLGETREFSRILAMLDRAERGLSFSPAAAARVRDDFGRLFHLPPASRLLLLLALLGQLAEDKHAVMLASPRADDPSPGESRERIDRILAHMHGNYTQPLRLDELAAIAALSPSGLHRLFRRHAGRSIGEYLMQLRIGDACARLSSSDQPVHHIAEAVGYNTLANFHRQFRRLKGMEPRRYRALFR